jgi:hypothetical protein
MFFLIESMPVCLHRPPVSAPNPAPIFVEAPPSSDDNEDDPGLRVVIDARFLNG